MRHFLRTFIGIASFAMVISAAQASILISDSDHGSANRDQFSVTKMRQEFDDVLQLHQARKMGVGVGVAGTTGLIGVNMQMNFALDVGVLLGYGAGPGFDAFNLGMKQLLGSSAVVPYYGFGYSRWTGHGGDMSHSNHLLRDKFLSDHELETGEFSENIFYPSFGVQYYQTSGDWTGASVYAEVLYLVDIDGLNGAPTGGVGFMYYF